MGATAARAARVETARARTGTLRVTRELREVAAIIFVVEVI